MRVKGVSEWRDVGLANVGSQAYPVEYREACDCYLMERP